MDDKTKRPDLPSEDEALGGSFSSPASYFEARLPEIAAAEDREAAIRRVVRAAEERFPERAGADLRGVCERMLSHWDSLDRRSPLLGPGHTVGAYRVEELVGHGGMGQVFRALSLRDGATVALKVPLLGLLSEPDRERVRREAESLRRLEHPNVVRLVDVVEHEQTPVLVFEWLNGDPLDTVLARRAAEEPVAEPPANPWQKTALQCVLEALDGLEAVHRAMVVHRDLKPSNLILDRDGRVRVIDFGLARMLDAETLTRSSEILGTPRYIAPELLSGAHAANAASDIYSMAVVAYELLARRPPFEDAASPSKVLAAIEAGDWQPLHRISDVSKAVSAVVAKAMDLDPRRRFGSAQEFAEALRGAAEEDVADLGVFGVRARGGRFVKRRRRALVVGGVACIGLVIASVLAVSRNALARERAARNAEKEVAFALLDEYRDAELNAAAPRRATGRRDALNAVLGCVDDLEDPFLARCFGAALALEIGEWIVAEELMAEVRRREHPVAVALHRALADRSGMRLRVERGDGWVDRTHRYFVARSGIGRTPMEKDLVCEALEPVEGDPVLGAAAGYALHVAHSRGGGGQQAYALAKLEVARRAVPDHPILLTSYSRCVQRLVRLDGFARHESAYVTAERDLRAYLDDHPDAGDARHALGTLLGVHPEPALAEISGHLMRAMSSMEDPPPALACDTATSLLDCGLLESDPTRKRELFEEARALFDRVLIVEPNMFEAQANAFMVYDFLGNDQKARDLAPRIDGERALPPNYQQAVDRVLGR